MAGNGRGLRKRHKQHPLVIRTSFRLFSKLERPLSRIHNATISLAQEVGLASRADSGRFDMAKPLMRPFRIWYDGLDAAENQMDIETLGESLRGVGQILRASSHFSFRHEYNKRRDTAYVRILVEPPRPGTWWCDAIAVAAAQTPLLSLISAPIFWETALSIAKATLFKRAGRRDLNDRLMDNLEKSLDAQTRALDAQSEAIRAQSSASENLADALKFHVAKDMRTVDSMISTVNRLNRLCTWLRFDQHAVGKGFCIGGEAEERAESRRGGFFVG